MIAACAMLRAFVIMCLAMCFIPGGDTAGKFLLGDYGIAPLFVAWARYCIGAAITLPVANRATFGLFRDPWVWGRSAAQLGTIICILSAVAVAPLADAFAALFIAPMVSYILSALWLKERVTVARSALMVAGFAGVLMVVRPGLGMAPGMGWGLASGVFYGVYLTASRAVSGAGSARDLLTTQMIVGSLCLCPAAIWLWPEVPFETVGLFLASGALSTCGNLLLLMAYSLAPASVLAPVAYVQIVAATAYGWIFFDDWPDMVAFLGIAVIIVSGIASARLSHGPAAPSRARPDRA